MSDLYCNSFAKYAFAGAQHLPILGSVVHTLT